MIGGLVEPVPSSGKEWVPGKCHTYLKVATGADEAAKYVDMARTVASRVDNASASAYTQKDIFMRSDHGHPCRQPCHYQHGTLAVGVDGLGSVNSSILILHGNANWHRWQCLH